ncbi:MAG: 30S ribosomal protein S12 methylthiotransferase RimO [Deltaproteobacteria bacterium]|jgi:tRNA-2-methylthio-N6-dimethylallyladenosine synthase/ribosomal protein S12 methylthiotransferase|nr:30S ribosomal protein S12 methylthiotransferase RimO [Deltaproteobacteria bacterium]
MLDIYVISLGCPKNRVDTERLLGGLNLPGTGGVRLVQDIAKAHVALVNTCAFISPAVRESVRTVLEQAAQIVRLPAGCRPLLAVAGCLPGRYGGGELARELPEVDLWLESKAMPAWPRLIMEALGRRDPSRRPADIGVEQTVDMLCPPRFLAEAPSYAWLKICEGCGQSCSFCSIPFIRGHVRSDTLPSLEAEAAYLLEQGAKELILVAQDLTAWGRDLPGSPGLIRLLERLLPLPGLKRLRLMYLYPAGITEELLHFIRQAGPELLPYFDVPMQHAHPDVLRSMGRPFSQDPFRIIERIRAALPEAALRTSLIAGFPGETEEMFETLCSFVRNARFHNLGAFSYYAEEGTAAATLPEQLPERVRDFRRDSLMEIQAEISEEILREFVGKNLEVLVDAPHPEWPGLWTGRTWFQAPEADGVVYLSGEGLSVGDLVRAEITESFTYDLNALT